MAYNSDYQAEILVRIYRQAYIDVLRRLMAQKHYTSFSAFYDMQLRAIEQVLKDLGDDTSKWIWINSAQAYATSAEETAARLSSMGYTVVDAAAFAQVHRRAVDAIAFNMANSIMDANLYLGRRWHDIYRQVGLEVIAQKEAAGATIKQAQRMLIDELASRGVYGFRDKLGREWKIENYARMVARTTSAEAQTIGTINACREYDCDLVKITEHAGPCDRCSAIAGQVFSISGQSDRYPALTGGNRPPIHPNCRHRLTPYVAELHEFRRRYNANVA